MGGNCYGGVSAMEQGVVPRTSLLTINLGINAKSFLNDGESSIFTAVFLKNLLHK